MNIAQFKVEDWMNEYEKYSIYDLANTTVQNLSFNELFALCDTDKFDFINNLCKQKQGYGHIKGAQELREGISKFYNTIPPENVITTIGAAGANHLVFYSLIEPSDSVVSVIPTYQQLYSIPASFGAKVKLLKLRRENNFLPDINELKSLVTDNTKLICINNPNNPTGAVIPSDMLERIAEIADEKGVYVLSDEVYRGLNQRDIEIPSMADIYDRGISVCSMSKVFSLAGLRLGWIASKNKEIIEKCFHHREYNMISCSITDETIAALAVKNADKIVNRNKKIITECLYILDDWVKNESHFSYIQPSAGTTALIDYDYDIPSKELCCRLAKEKGVFLTPGFCFEEENCFRIGYCKSPQVLQQGLKKISGFIKENI